MGISITVTIIIITVIASMYAFNKPEKLQKWMMNPYMIYNRKEYFRFLTSGFIHSNYMHLFFNMIALYFFGRNVEIIFKHLFGNSGAFIFIFFYLAGILVSDIPTYLKNRNNIYYNSLGASGGVAAILFCSILYYPVSSIYVYFIPVPGFILGALYIIYSYRQGKRQGDNINHDAHLWGALFGIAFTIATNPAVVRIFFEQLLNFKLF